jgi:hypothetical protein
MRLRCRLGWHLWGFWSEAERRGYDSHLSQHKECRRCGRVRTARA